MIIAVINEKGGVGKSTIAINIAVCFQQMGYSVLLADSDLQATARDWHQANGASTLKVVGLDRPTLDVDIQLYVDSFEIIIIDSGARLQEMTLKAIKCADVILIPVQPSPYDIWGSSKIVELIKARQEMTGGKPKAAFVISRQKKGTKIGEDVRKAVAEYGFKVLAHGTFDRTVYAVSATEGKAVVDTDHKDAKQEVELLTNEIYEFACGETNNVICK